jgi:hypothetical protein
MEMTKKKSFVSLIMILLGVLIPIGIIALTSCNKQIVDTTYSFDTAIMYVGGEWLTVKVDSWKDYEDAEIRSRSKQKMVMFISGTFNECYSDKFQVRYIS